jgi:hypothetical protein
MLNIAKIKPGLLVSVKTRQHGGCGFVAGSLYGKDRRHGGQLFLAWSREP